MVVAPEVVFRKLLVDHTDDFDHLFVGELRLSGKDPHDIERGPTVIPVLASVDQCIGVIIGRHDLVVSALIGLGHFTERDNERAASFIRLNRRSHQVVPSVEWVVVLVVNLDRAVLSVLVVGNDAARSDSLIEKLVASDLVPLSSVPRKINGFH